MSENTITAVEIVETDFGEKVLLKSPFEAKQYIKYMPWQPGDGVNYDELEDDAETPDFNFSSEFGTYAKPLYEDGQFAGWKVAVDSFPEAVEFLESVGFDVDVESAVNQEALQ